MKSENLNNLLNKNHSNWGFYFLVILFVLWFGFLVCWNQNTEAILPVQLIQNQMIEKENPITSAVYMILKPGTKVLKGDTIGVKVDSLKWTQVNLLESTLLHYENKRWLINGLSGIKTQIDTLDIDLKELISSLSANINVKPKNPKVKLEKIVSYVSTNNKTAIIKAEEKLKILQLQYAQKKIEYTDLLKASKELNLLKQEKETKNEIIKYVPAKKPANPKVLITNLDNISADSERRIFALKEFIKQWKEQNIIIADKEGIINCKTDRQKLQSCFTITKSNKRIYAFNNPGFIDLDSIQVSYLNKDGREIQKYNAVKDSIKDRYIIQDVSGEFELFTLANKNARVLYKVQGQSYYTWLKDRLSYK